MTVNRIFISHLRKSTLQKLMTTNVLQKTSVLESFFNSLFLTAGLQICNFIKKRLQNRCFPVKFTKFQNTFSYKTPPVAAPVIVIHRFEYVISTQKIMRKVPFMRNVPVYTIILKDLNLKTTIPLYTSYCLNSISFRFVFSSMRIE